MAGTDAAAAAAAVLRAVVSLMSLSVVFFSFFLPFYNVRRYLFLFSHLQSRNARL